MRGNESWMEMRVNYHRWLDGKVVKILSVYFFFPDSFFFFKRLNLQIFYGFIHFNQLSFCSSLYYYF